MTAFFLFLCGGIWQDIRTKNLSVWFLVGFGLFGFTAGVFLGKSIPAMLLSAGVGGVILFISRLTDGAIGAGDGWFFVVSGMFLTVSENLLLLFSGLAFCGIYGLGLTAAAFAGNVNIRKKKLPFLPFLFPVGLWMVFL